MTATTTSPEAPERQVQTGAGPEVGLHRMADVAAEQAVLGAMMLSSRAADDVIEILQSQDFYRPSHSTVYAVLVSLLARSEPTDPVALAHALESAGDLNRVGGRSYLHTLMASVPITASAGYYARIVAEHAARRRILDSAVRIGQLAQDMGRDVTDVVDAAQRAVHEATVGRHSIGVDRVSEYAPDEIAHLVDVVEGRVPRGLSTGLGELDKILGGMLPGQLIIPAGRPGMGKTCCAFGFAKAVARRGIPSLVVTVEMSKREMTWRLWSDVAEIDLAKFTSGDLTRADLAKIREAEETIDRWPLHIVDTASTIAEIRSVARRFRQRHGRIGVLVVDYLQRLRSTTKHDRRDLEVGSFARDLKSLARELETSIVAPAQLNRGSEGRTDKRPQLSDLRDSGELEQEADIVILLHREDYYDKETERAGEVDLIVAKHRNGPTDTAAVVAQLHYARFVDMGYDEEPY